MKISLRFVSWLDILDMPSCNIPYILFKLEEIKADEAPFLCENMLLKLFSRRCALTRFHFRSKIHGYFEDSNIGVAKPLRVAKNEKAFAPSLRLRASAVNDPTPISTVALRAISVIRLIRDSDLSRET